MSSFGDNRQCQNSHETLIPLSLDLFSSDYLAHHGILGMKWGIRRFQNRDGTRTVLGRERYGQSKVSRKYDVSRYLNIDGSLTEKGYDRLEKYQKNAIAKNDKTYDKYSKKYAKQAEKYLRKADKEKDASKAEELRAKAEDALSRKNRADTNRKNVDDYYKNISFQEALADQQRQSEDRAHTAKTIAKVGAGVAGTALAVATGAGVVAAGKALAGLGTTGVGALAMKYTDMGIRAYADMRSFVMSTYVDEVLTNVQRTGSDRNIGTQLGKIATNVNSGYQSVPGPKISDGLQSEVANIVRSGVSGVAQGLSQSTIPVSTAVADVHSTAAYTQDLAADILNRYG